MSSKSEFARHTGVSRETLEKFELYEATLRKWNGTINLVARSTLDELWARHFLDSASAFEHQSKYTGKWLDLGSGGGFPAIVNALLAQDQSLDVQTTCIETDIRKSEFLRTVARTTGITLNVISRRIEECPPQKADVITARALASLEKLLTHMHIHQSPNGVAFFHKGRGWKSELEEAKITWHFNHDIIPSITDPDAVILKIGTLRNA